MTENILKFPLFYLLNMEFFEFSLSKFPPSKDKRVGISKNFLSCLTLFLYIYHGKYYPSETY